MSSARPYIGCKIALLSKAQNRYEGILYTIDKVNSTVVLAKVKCFGTEGRPTGRPTPPKDDVFEYITFRGSDIKDITPCDPPVSHRGLPVDPAIVQSSSSGSPGVYSALGQYSPLQMPAYNQLAASFLLNQQYAAALGLGLQVQRGPMVEKAVQTLHLEASWQRRGFNPPQEQRRKPRGAGGETSLSRRGFRANVNPGPAPSARQESSERRRDENKPPSGRQARRRGNPGQGQTTTTAAKAPSATIKFDTDFDFDSSNAKFDKELLEREVLDRRKDGSLGQLGDDTISDVEGYYFGPKCYYDKSKSFYDNIPSDGNIRLTWAEERKRNLETFGMPGRFFRGRGFAGGSRRGGRAGLASRRL